MTDRPKREPRPAVGLIFPEALYRKEALCRALGWGRVSWRRARREGLRVLCCGRCRYVRGEDAIAYLERAGREEGLE